MVFHKKIKKMIERIEFLDEENLILIGRNSFYVFNLKDMNLTNEIVFSIKEKINDIKIVIYLEKTFVILGLENGEVIVFERNSLLNEEKYLAKFKAYDVRVKKIDVV